VFRSKLGILLALEYPLMKIEKMKHRLRHALVLVMVMVLVLVLVLKKTMALVKPKT
jgi:hypothetical protein